MSEVRAALDSGRQELASLRAENARLRAATGADLEQEIAAGAVGLLSQAQLIADRAVADAEQYARDMVLAARDQYREVLERAERSAGHVAAALATTPEGPSVPEIEYVRTYAKVAQIQLRSVLDALTEQVDRLGSLPQHDAEPAESSTTHEPVEEPVGEPDWARPTATRGSYVEPESFTMPASFTDSRFVLRAGIVLRVAGAPRGASRSSQLSRQRVIERPARSSATRARVQRVLGHPLETDAIQLPRGGEGHLVEDNDLLGCLVADLRPREADQLDVGRPLAALAQRDVRADVLAVDLVADSDDARRCRRTDAPAGRPRSPAG